MLSDLFSISLRIRSILLAVLFASVGANALVVVLVINLEGEGTATSVIGWVMSGYAIGVLLGSQLGYLLIDRSGHFRGYAAAAALVVLSVSLHMFTTNEWVVFILRLLVGFFMSILYLILESWLNATSEHHTRATIYALYQVFFSLGILLAPFLATVYNPSDSRAIALTIMALSISVTPIMLTRFPSPQMEGSQKRLSLIEMLRDTPSGTVMSIIAGLSYISLGTLLPIYALWLTLDKHQIAILLALATGSSILFQIPVGKLSDRYDERWILLGLSVICLISAGVTYLLSQYAVNWWLIVVLIVLLGGSISTIYPVCVKFIFNQMDSDKAVGAMSSLMIFFSSGLILGPILSSQVMEWLNPSGLFIFLSALMILALVFMIYRVKVSRFPSGDWENIPYVITVQMVRPVNANLDPRTDYLVTRVSNSSIQALANSISVTPAKTRQLIEQTIPHLEGYMPEEILEALVMIKPRYCGRIVKTMLALYPDKVIPFTQSLGDLISLNKPTINTVLFEALTQHASQETKQDIEEMFATYLASTETTETAGTPASQDAQ